MVSARRSVLLQNGIQSSDFTDTLLEQESKRYRKLHGILQAILVELGIPVSRSPVEYGGQKRVSCDMRACRKTSRNAAILETHGKAKKAI